MTTDREALVSGSVREVPDGWRLVPVNEHFDALMAALDRAERKGYLSDAIAESWVDFDYMCALAADPSRAQEERKPLSEEQIADIVLRDVYEGDESIPYRHDWTRETGVPFARAIERAHGITPADGSAGSAA
jgi:hypothetical protein